MTTTARAQSDKPASATAVCHNEREIPAKTDKSELAGAVCHFERVRGRGDAEVARLAELQHGCVHRAQMLAAGLGKDAILRRVRAGWLHRVHSHVYQLGPRPERLGPVMAAALQLRGNAAVSGPAAAAVWGLLETVPETVELTVVGRNARPQPGLRIRRVPTLDHRDVRWKAGIPLTAPARTLIDLAAARPDPLELENALAQALHRSLTTGAQIRAALERAPGRPGSAMLRTLTAALAGAHTDPARTRSVYERKLLELIVAAGLPKPVTNVPVAGHEVDMLWPEHKLVVEFDGFAFHHDRKAFETDRLRDQHLVVAGYRVIRITARQLDQAPFAVIANLAAALR
ncbi:MAG TPA: type IV toxin-antitoxin system AbiEi family antitoxin domain-containing protein [Solirubrobacteraceae bacterium]|nr:type IV toxin-antitoxin system AbiEi family antitoxin domain-containing protein [Solirubrobacteraceae bacterium]